MKITKYPQSCVLIEGKKKILIDPGKLEFDEKFLEQWKDVEIVLVTHKHHDHCVPEIVNKLVEKGAKIYTTREVADFNNLNAEIVKEGDKIEDGLIEVVKAVHGYLPIFKNPAKAINENVGYIINDEKRVYHTSDSICFKNEYKCDVLLIPVVNHGIVMGPFDAALFAKETEASLIIPIHYDNPIHPINKEEVEKEFKENNLNYRFLEIGECIEI